MPTTYLPDEDHCVRYVTWAKLRKDEDDNVLGVLGIAFRLRDDEEYLSATWVEFCEGPTLNERVEAAVRIVRASKLTVSPRSGFAIGNVSAIKQACLNDRRKHKVRVIHQQEDDNPAHVALRGWPADNDDLLDLLAEDAWSKFVLNKDIVP